MLDRTSASIPSVKTAHQYRVPEIHCGRRHDSNRNCSPFTTQEINRKVSDTCAPGDSLTSLRHVAVVQMHTRGNPRKPTVWKAGIVGAVGATAAEQTWFVRP